MSKEICWLMTTHCNQSCKYCHRFLDINDLSDIEYHQILEKLITYKVDYITLGGGEALLINNIEQLINKMYNAKIRIKLVTNGLLITPKLKRTILNKISNITFSIDSLNEITNENLGRGKNHYENIRASLDLLNSMKNPPEVCINTVITKINIVDIQEFPDFLKKYNIKQWRIFRFCPIRELSLKNREHFEITNDNFKKIKEFIKNINLKINVKFRDYDEMDSEYLLITPKGELCVSVNNKDQIVGNMIHDNLSKYFKLD